MPVRLEKFFDKIPEPTDGELQLFFDQYKKTPFDPTSPTPGFMIPAQVKASWVSADPGSAFYQTRAQAVSFLEMTPLGWSGPCAPLVNAARLGVAPLAFEQRLAQNYENHKKGINARGYQDAPLTEPSLPALLAHLGKPTPQAIASLVAASAGDLWIAGPAAYRAQQYRLHEKELQPLVAAADKRRAEFAAHLTGLCWAVSFHALWLAWTPGSDTLFAHGRRLQGARKKSTKPRWHAAGSTPT